jgi:hypothetical protein
VRDWELLGAVREIIQNVLDSKVPIEWSIAGHTLTVTSRTTVERGAMSELGRRTHQSGLR